MAEPLPAADPAGDAILTVEGLHTFIRTDGGIVRAVDDVSFTLRRGEILGLVGESGSGKSVTCRTLMGLMPSPPAWSIGEVDYAERPGRNLLTVGGAELQRLRGAHLSMIFQDPMSALNPVMRVGDQIEEAVAAHARLGPRERRRAALQLLDRVGIPAASRRMRGYPHEFSGGMRQRVLIAAAIASHPRVLFADEPTTALDVIIQDQILSLLLELQRDFGMSMILVSHDLGVIAEMCDRIAVMYGGQIVELADARTLLTEPRHPYTISLLRSLPDADRKTKYLQSIPGTPPRLVDIEPGCRFATRCPLATPECRTWETELLAAAGAHLVRCRRHDDARRPEAWPTQSYES